LAFPCDISDSTAVQEMAGRVVSSLGGVDLLATAAGISGPRPALEMTSQDWNRVVQTNLSGTFHVIQSIGRGMVAARRGSIVAIASVDSFGGHSARVHYTASKHGILGIVRTLALEWGRFGVRVNALSPGVVDTPLLRSIVPSEHLNGVMKDRTALGRLSSVEEQALATLFLLSDASSYITAANLVVDGGLSAGAFTHLNGADLGS